MPPHSLQGGHSLHRETHHHLSLLDGSVSNPRKGIPTQSLHSAHSIHSAQSLHCENNENFSHEWLPRNHIKDIPLDATIKTANTVDDEDAPTLVEKVETAKSNDEQDSNPSWFESILDCLPCTNHRAIGPGSASTEERHCCECGNKLTEDYHMEIQVRTVMDKKTGETSKVEERLYFMPSCFETRKLRNHHKDSGYRFVLDELHAFFEVKRQRTKELRLQARAAQKGKAKARAQASAKQVRAHRVEAQANATYSRKRQEAERSAALLKMASLAQESAKIVRQRQEDERRRQEAERSAVFSQYETDLANRLAKARAEAWAKSADFAASDKAEQRRRNSNESSRGTSQGTSQTTSPKAPPRSKIAKRAKKAVKKIACFSHSNKADNKGTWEATVDSTSGKTYYYNTTTLETTWRNPHSHSFLREKQQKRMSF